MKEDVIFETTLIKVDVTEYYYDAKITLPSNYKITNIVELNGLLEKHGANIPFETNIDDHEISINNNK